MSALNKATNVMAGSSYNISTMNIDMSKCIIKEDENHSRLDTDELKKTVDSLMGSYPALTEYRKELLSHRAFRIDDLLCDIVGRDLSVFDGVDCVYITYVRNKVQMIIYHDGDLLEIYNGVTSKGRVVDVQVKSENVIIMKEVHQYPFEVMMDVTREIKTNYFICINCKYKIRHGVTIPNIIRLKTPVVLDSNKVLTSIIAVEGEPITVHGSAVIEASVPILASGVKVVTIKGSGTLILEATGDKQPCIGPQTVIGLSYGRWEPGGAPPEKIIIDGVMVQCKSKVENFTLGGYGREAVPEVVLLNGGQIKCPEAEGKRIVTKQARAPEGSTKISENMEYGILADDMTMEDMIDPGVKILMKELPESMHKFVVPTTKVENITEAIRLCNVCSSIDVSRVLNGSDRINYARTAALVGDNSIYDDREFKLELNKMNSLIIRYVDRTKVLTKVGDMSDEDIVMCLIINIYNSLIPNLSEYDYEVLFEMIPSYTFDGWVRGDKRRSVEAYISKHESRRQLACGLREYMKIKECTYDLRM